MVTADMLRDALRAYARSSSTDLLATQDLGITDKGKLTIKPHVEGDLELLAEKLNRVMANRR